MRCLYDLITPFSYTLDHCYTCTYGKWLNRIVVRGILYLHFAKVCQDNLLYVLHQSLEVDRLMSNNKIIAFPTLPYTLLFMRDGKLTCLNEML